MRGRRERQPRRMTDQAIRTGPIGGGGGSPRSDDSQSGGDGGRQGQGLHADGADQSQDTQGQPNGDQTQNGNGSQDAGGQTDTSSGNGADQSSQQRTSPYGHTPEEAAQFEALKKGKVHGDRKIAAQGEEISALTKERDELKAKVTKLGEEIGTIKGTVAQMMARGGRGRNGNATADFGGDYDYGNDGTYDAGGDQSGGTRDQGQGDVTAQFAEEIDGLKYVLSGMHKDFKGLQNDYGNDKAAREREQELAYIQTTLHVDPEAAEVFHTALENRDIGALAQAFNLTLPAQAREAAKAQRESQRQATYHPGAATGAPYAPAVTDDTVLRQEGERIIAMDDGHLKARAVEKFMETYPEGFNILVELGGYNM